MGALTLVAFSYIEEFHSLRLRQLLRPTYMIWTYVTVKHKLEVPDYSRNLRHCHAHTNLYSDNKEGDIILIYYIDFRLLGILCVVLWWMRMYVNSSIVWIFIDTLILKILEFLMHGFLTSKTYFSCMFWIFKTSMLNIERLIFIIHPYDFIIISS